MADVQNTWLLGSDAGPATEWVAARFVCKKKKRKERLTDSTCINLIN